MFVSKSIEFSNVWFSARKITDKVLCISWSTHCSNIHMWETLLSTKCVQRLISIATVTLPNAAYKASELTPHAHKVLVLCSLDCCCRNLKPSLWQPWIKRKQQQKGPWVLSHILLCFQAGQCHSKHHIVVLISLKEIIFNDVMYLFNIRNYFVFPKRLSLPPWAQMNVQKLTPAKYCHLLLASARASSAPWQASEVPSFAAATMIATTDTNKLIRKQFCKKE